MRLEREQPRTAADGEFRDGPRAIVLGADDSPTARRAACFAAGLARRNRAALVVVHVRAPLPIACSFDGLGLPVEDAPEDGERCPILEEIAELSAVGFGVSVERVLREGRPDREIAKLANALRADVVVVGAARRRLRLRPSVATRLARYGCWPVTVVP